MAVCLLMFNIVTVSMNGMELEGGREEKHFDTFHIFSTVTLYISLHDKCTSYYINDLLIFSI